MSDYHRIARRITLTLFAAQSLGSAAFVASATISPIAGAQLGSAAVLAGVPGAVYLLGSAVAAWGWGWAMERFGRRSGLVSGLMLGVAGAGTAALALVAQSFALLLGGLLLMGTTHAALQFGRFIAAEVNPPALRAGALANVVLGGTVGAVLGPLMVGPLGRLMLASGLPALSGPYLAAAVLFVLTAILIAVWLRPEPRDVGRQLALRYGEQPGTVEAARPLGAILRQPAVIAAVGSLVCAQLAMIMLMVITSLYMAGHNHSLDAIAVVISSHTVGMFAFSVLSGRLADRIGRPPVIAIGGATLLLACVLAPISPQVVPLGVALFLLGLGWNFCFVGGSALLSDQLAPAERTRTQGANDFLIGVTSALGSTTSGLVYATLGFGWMAVLGATVAAVPLILALWVAGQSRRTAPVAPG